MNKVKALLSKLRIGSVLRFARANPVLLMDAAKYLTVALVMFGIPVPPGMDVLISAALFIVLTLITHHLVMPADKAKALIEDAAKAAAPLVKAVEGDQGPEAVDSTQVIPPVK